MALPIWRFSVAWLDYSCIRFKSVSFSTIESVSPLAQLSPPSQTSSSSLMLLLSVTHFTLISLRAGALFCLEALSWNDLIFCVVPSPYSLETLPLLFEFEAVVDDVSPDEPAPFSS